MSDIEYAILVDALLEGVDINKTKQNETNNILTMAAFEVKYKYGEKLGMMIAVCNTQEEIPQCLAAAGVAGAEITSVRAPRITLKF